MDAAIVGACRIGYCRVGVYKDDWSPLITQFEGIGSCDVTWRRLVLNNRDDTTGWYTKSFNEQTIKGILIPRGATSTAMAAGVYVRLDAVFRAVEPLVVGDEIQSADSVYYEVKTVKPHRVGDAFWFRDYDLTELPFHEITGSGQPTVSVDDARTNTKTYLETYINEDGALNPVNWIVAYGNPDYSLIKVFQNKSVDLIFNILDPTTTPLKGHDHYVYGYRELVPIVTTCIDKSGISGTQLRWSASAELRRVVEDHPLGSLRNFSEEAPYEKRLGSTVLYQQRFVLDYGRNKT